MFRRTAPVGLLFALGTSILSMIGAGPSFAEGPHAHPAPEPRCTDVSLSKMLIQVSWRDIKIKIDLDKPCKVTEDLHARVFGGARQELPSQGQPDPSGTCLFYISRVLKFTGSSPLQLVFDGPAGDMHWLRPVGGSFDDGRWVLMLEGEHDQDGVTRIAKADVASGGYFGRELRSS